METASDWYTRWVSSSGFEGVGRSSSAQLAFREDSSMFEEKGILESSEVRKRNGIDTRAFPNERRNYAENYNPDPEKKTHLPELKLGSILLWAHGT